MKLDCLAKECLDRSNIADRIYAELGQRLIAQARRQAAQHGVNRRPVSMQRLPPIDLADHGTIFAATELALRLWFRAIFI
jgi:hypothetical protein